MFVDKQPIFLKKVVAVTVSTVVVEPEVQFVTQYYYVNSTEEVTVNKPILPPNFGQLSAAAILFGIVLLGLGLLHNEPMEEKKRRSTKRSE